MDELATLHAAFWGSDLAWLPTPSGMKRKPVDSGMANRRAQFIVSALDQFAQDMPSVFRRLGELYAMRSLDVIGLFSEGECTLIHGDTHSGNLFVGAGRRTGFYDWAVAGRGPGVRDVAEEASLIARYRRALAAHGVLLDERTASEQYRLFSVYSWIAAASTAAMGSRWQPIDVSRAAMISTTQAIDDLDAVGLLEARLADQ
jgi:hypothetical protein